MKSLPSEAKPKTGVRTGKGGGRKRAQKPVIPRADSVGSPINGNVERLNAYQMRAFELRTLDYHLFEIAEKIAHEFNLPRVPATTTVFNWLERANYAYQLDIAKMAERLRIDQFNQLEQLKSKWMAVACTNDIAIKRWVMTKEGPQPELDENAIKEQIAATKEVVRIMARQAKLLGLDMEKKTEEENVDLNTLQMWIVGKVNDEMASEMRANAQAIDVNATSVPKPLTLEMRSGRTEIDEMEGL